MQNKKVISDDVKNVITNGNITLDKYYKNLNVNIPIPSGYVSPSGTKVVTTKANNIDVGNFKYADTSGMYTEAEYQTLLNKIAGMDTQSSKIQENATSCNFDFGYIPRIIFIILSDKNNNSYCFYSLNSCNNFFFQNFTSTSGSSSNNGFSISNTQISMTVSSNIWYGQTAYAYAIK